MVNLKNVISPQFFGIHRGLKNDEYDEVILNGGRGSAKSCFASEEVVLGMMKDPTANAVVLRRYQNELRDTVFGQIMWAIEKLGCSHAWRSGVSPMQFIYIPTGQKILFKAADNPAKMKSVNFGKGQLKYLWAEEVDQFGSMDEIRNITQSMFRSGEVSPVFFMSYNPPKSARSWINQESKIEKHRRIVHHSTYLDVPEEWLGRRFIAEAEHLKETNKSAYDHEYLGIETGTGLEIFNNIELRRVDDAEIEQFDNIRQGLDFGYAVDPVAFNACHYDKTRKTLHIFEEFNAITCSNSRLFDNIKHRIDHNTFADSAEPKSIAELNDLAGKRAFRPVKKGPDSIDFGIKFLQGLEKIIIDPNRCPNTAREFTNYALTMDNNGQIRSSYPDKENHHIDAVRYSTRDDQDNRNKGGWG